MGHSGVLNYSYTKYLCVLSHMTHENFNKVVINEYNKQISGDIQKISSRYNTNYQKS